MYCFLIGICLYGTSILYKDIKNIWNIDRERQGQNILVYVVIILIQVNIVSNMPSLSYIYNKKVGTFEKMEFVALDRRIADRPVYTVTIRNCETQKLEKCKDIPIDYNYNLKKGTKLEIYALAQGYNPSYYIAKINGKTTPYFRKRYQLRPYEREFAFLLLSINALLLFLLTRKDYILHKKQCGKTWYRLCVLTCILYGSVPWIAYWNRDYEIKIKVPIVIIYLFLGFFEFSFARSISMLEKPELWEKEKRKKLEEKQQFEKEMEEWNRKEEKKQLAIEMDRSEEHQFQQMSYSVTKQYCNMKFRYKMKHSMESVLVLGVLVAMAAFIGPLTLDKLLAWYSYIAIAGVFMILLIIGVGYRIAYHKHKQFKELLASGKVLEYTTVIAEIGKEKRFLCSDGHQKVWKMKYDDMKVKEGQEVVVIYVPSTGEMITEKPDIFENWQERREEPEEKQQSENEMEENERGQQEKMENQQTDQSKEYQFQQMSYFMTQQYCKLKSRNSMKNRMENGVLLAGVLVAAAAFIPLNSDKLFAWYKYIVSTSVILGVLIIASGCIRGVRNYKKFKGIPASGKPLEYTTVVAEIGEEKKFRCSDGHEEVWRMEYDDDAKVKDGHEVVVIYAPSTGEFMTEKTDILDRIYGISKSQQVRQKNVKNQPEPDISQERTAGENERKENDMMENDRKVNDRETNIGTGNTGERNIGKGSLGASFGTLIGIAAIILMKQLGYPELIAGLIMGFCTFGGYYLLAKEIGKHGTLLCCYFMFTQVYVGLWISYGIEIHRLYHIRGIECVGAVIEFVVNGKIPLSSCIIDLVMVYGFAAVGALPVVLRHFKRTEDNE